MSDKKLFFNDETKKVSFSPGDGFDEIRDICTMEEFRKSLESHFEEPCSLDQAEKEAFDTCQHFEGFLINDCGDHVFAIRL